MSDWEDWCRDSSLLSQLLLTETDDFNATVESLRIEGPGPLHPRLVLAALLFEVEKIARIAESVFGDDPQFEVRNLHQQIRTLADQWGEGALVDMYLAWYGESHSGQSEPDKAPPQSQKTNQDLAGDFALEVLNSPAAPPRGRRWRTAVSRAVQDKLKAKGRVLEVDTISRYIRPTLDGWEQTHPL